MYSINVISVRTMITVRYRAGVNNSGMSVKRGSTVYANTRQCMHIAPRVMHFSAFISTSSCICTCSAHSIDCVSQSRNP